MIRGFVMAGLGLLVAAACSSHGVVSADAALDGDVPVDHAPPIADARAEHVPPPPDAQASPPMGVFFPDPAPMSCQADGGDCDFPAPACATPLCTGEGAPCEYPPWVVYYDNPRCVNGACVWDRRYFQCDVSHRCQSGGCVFNGTLPLAP